MSQAIAADTGGTVRLDENVSLYIPPGSLQNDTVISIAPVTDVPDGEADGFSDFGTAYRFSPPGTQFALDKPAVLRVPAAASTSIRA